MWFMTLKAKRIIISILSLSLLANLFLAIYVAQIKTNTTSYKNQIVELKKENERLEKDMENLEEDKETLEENNDALLEDKKFFKDQYQKYLEYSEELQNQMGVYAQ